VGSSVTVEILIVGRSNGWRLRETSTSRIEALHDRKDHEGANSAAPMSYMRAHLRPEPLGVVPTILEGGSEGPHLPRPRLTETLLTICRTFRTLPSGTLSR